MEIIVVWLSLLFTCVHALNNGPIIGILAQTTDGSITKYGDTYIRALYVHFLQQSGARVVPIRVDESPDYYADIMKKINGVLFPGGDKNFTTSYLARSSRYIYDLAVQANDAGDYFPLWGTCQGFQLLTNLTARENLLVPTDSENISLPLDLDPGYKKSRMFGPAPENIMKILSSENITPNFHHFAVTVKDFDGTPSLTSFYRKLSTNKDRQGVEFVSTIEGYKYPFYGIQWHAEKLNYEFDPHVSLQHTSDAVLVSQYLSNFFVNEARRSSHHYPSFEAESQAVIQNFPVTYAYDSDHYENYYFLKL